jgi:hypothetical protein
MNDNEFEPRRWWQGWQFNWPMALMSGAIALVGVIGSRLGQ